VQRYFVGVFGAALLLDAKEGGREIHLSSCSEHSPRDFDILLGDAIDEALTILLSAEVADAIYLNLEKFHSIPKDEIPHQLETLSMILENTFGQPSSRTISKAIARKFFAKLELTFPKHYNPAWTLVDYIDEARVKLRSKTHDT